MWHVIFTHLRVKKSATMSKGGPFKKRTPDITTVVQF